MIPLGDDNFQSIPIDFTFNYFTQSFTTLKISTNGFVYFSGSYKCCLLSQPLSSNIISGLNYDLNTLNGGKIFYQYITSSDTYLYNAVKADLNKLNANFAPTNILRITFDNVHDYDNDNKLATFQIVLAKDSGSLSYVMVKYTSCIDSLLNAPGLYYMNTTSHQQLSISFQNPCTSSNVNSNGLWVYDVSNFPSSLFFLWFICLFQLKKSHYINQTPVIIPKTPVRITEYVLLMVQALHAIAQLDSTVIHAQKVKYNLTENEKKCVIDYY